MRSAAAGLFVAAVLATQAVTAGAVFGAPARPNIILIVIDDMGWSDSAVYGSTFYETPAIDRLAREGVRFTNFYAAG